MSTEETQSDPAPAREEGSKERVGLTNAKRPVEHEVEIEVLLELDRRSERRLPRSRCKQADEDGKGDEGEEDQARTTCLRLSAEVAAKGQVNQMGQTFEGARSETHSGSSSVAAYIGLLLGDLLKGSLVVVRWRVVVLLGVGGQGSLLVLAAEVDGCV